MTEDGRLLEEYRRATEALLDAITVLQGRLHTRDATESKRLAQLVEKCNQELDRIRREFERRGGGLNI
jgi:hypothetical protein